MRPCAICGEETVSADGTCAGCGVSRGPLTPPAHPASPARRPVPDPPIDAAETTPLPPISASPPVPGASAATARMPPKPPEWRTPAAPEPVPPPTAPPPAPPVVGYDAPSPALAGAERAHPLAVALVAIAGVLSLAVFGAVVVRFVEADSRAADQLAGQAEGPVAVSSIAPRPSPSGPPSAPAPSPSAVPAVIADECLAGRWRVVEQREIVALPGIGTTVVTLTGDGPAVTYETAGTGVADYGSGTVYAATVDGRDVRITVTGEVTFEFAAADGVTAATAARSAATFTVEDRAAEPAAWPASLTEWAYECGQGEVALTGPDAQRERLRRYE